MRTLSRGGPHERCGGDDRIYCVKVFVCALSCLNISLVAHRTSCVCIVREPLPKYNKLTHNKKKISSAPSQPHTQRDEGWYVTCSRATTENTKMRPICQVVHNRQESKRESQSLIHTGKWWHIIPFESNTRYRVYRYYACTVYSLNKCIMYPFSSLNFCSFHLWFSTSSDFVSIYLSSFSTLSTIIEEQSQVSQPTR